MKFESSFGVYKQPFLGSHSKKHSLDDKCSHQAHWAWGSYDELVVMVAWNWWNENVIQFGLQLI